MRLIVTLLCIVSACLVGAPHIGYLMPAGAQQGTTVDILVGGQQLWGIKSAEISGSGVTLEAIEVVRGFPHPAASQRKYLQKWSKAIDAGNPEKPPVPEYTADWRKHPFWEKLSELTPLQRDLTLRYIYIRRNPLQASPAIASNIILRLKVAPDATPGQRELRLRTNTILSNPLKFYVGTAPEFREDFFQIPPKKPAVTTFAVPAAINGQIMPGETDYFNFTASKGQIITFTMIARHLVPFIGDGVPGHFQPTLEVVNAAGKSLAYADDYYFNPDPILEFTAPADGAYTLVVRDALYRGREDFVYRIVASTAPKQPFAMAPLPELPGELPRVEVPLNSNTPFPVSVPALLHGAVAPGQTREFNFSAEKGQLVVMEVFARRLGSPLDSLLQLFDQDGKLLAQNDDFHRLKAGTILHGAADSYLTFTAPATGTYTLRLRDTTGAGGKDYQYYLRIDQKRPRFQVYTVPSAIAVGINNATPVTFVVQRYDGFNEEIKLSVKGNNHFSFVGANSIPPGCDRATLTLKAKFGKGIPPRHVAEFVASGAGYTTTVCPGDEAMQAFAYTHIAPAQQLWLTRSWTAGNGYFAWFNNSKSLNLNGAPRSVVVTINPKRFPADGDATLELVDPPSWLSVTDASHATYTSATSPKDSPKQLRLTIQAGKGAAPHNQLFKVVYKYNSKPDKTGKIHRRTATTYLPVLRLWP